MAARQEEEAPGVLTAEQYFYDQPCGPSELVAGAIVARSPNFPRHGRVEARITSFLGRYLEAHPIGEAMCGDAGFVLRRNPDTVRAPDVAFLVNERIPDEESDEAFFPGAPDLAVEVVSPSDRWSEVEAKVFEYLAAGAREVWVANPQQMTIHVYARGKLAGGFTVDETLTSELLPGFSMPLRAVFGRRK